MTKAKAKKHKSGSKGAFYTPKEIVANPPFSISLREKKRDLAPTFAKVYEAALGAAEPLNDALAMMKRLACDYTGADKAICDGVVGTLAKCVLGVGSVCGTLRVIEDAVG